MYSLTKMKFKNVFKSKFNSMLALEPIMFLRLIFGLYYKLSTSTIICLLAKLHCSVILITIIVLNYLILFYRGSKITALEHALVLLIESVVCILLSLITEEDYVLKFSKKLYAQNLSLFQKSQSSVAPHLAFLIVVIGRFINLLLTPLVVITFNYILYGLMYMACTTSYLTSVYISDGYRKSISNIRTLLNDKFKDPNLTENEMLVYVRIFVNSYKNFSNTFASTITILRIKVVFVFTSSLVYYFV